MSTTPIGSDAYNAHEIGSAFTDLIDYFDKGAAYPVGTVRTWGGREYMKIHGGKWRLKETKRGPKARDAENFKGTGLEDHPLNAVYGRMSAKQLSGLRKLLDVKKTELTKELNSAAGDAQKVLDNPEKYPKSVQNKAESLKNIREGLKLLAAHSDIAYDAEAQQPKKENKKSKTGGPTPHPKRKNVMVADTQQPVEDQAVDVVDKQGLVLSYVDAQGQEHEVAKVGGVVVDRNNATRALVSAKTAEDAVKKVRDIAESKDKSKSEPEPQTTMPKELQEMLKEHDFSKIDFKQTPEGLTDGTFGVNSEGKPLVTDIKVMPNSQGDYGFSFQVNLPGKKPYKGYSGFGAASADGFKYYLKQSSDYIKNSLKYFEALQAQEDEMAKTKAKYSSSLKPDQAFGSFKIDKPVPVKAIPEMTTKVGIFGKQQVVSFKPGRASFVDFKGQDGNLSALYIAKKGSRYTVFDHNSGKIVIDSKALPVGFNETQTVNAVQTIIARWAEKNGVDSSAFNDKMLFEGAELANRKGYEPLSLLQSQIKSGSFKNWIGDADEKVLELPFGGAAVFKNYKGSSGAGQEFTVEYRPKKDGTAPSPLNVIRSEKEMDGILTYLQNGIRSSSSDS